MTKAGCAVCGDGFWVTGVLHGMRLPRPPQPSVEAIPSGVVRLRRSSTPVRLGGEMPPLLPLERQETSRKIRHSCESRLRGQRRRSRGSCSPNYARKLIQGPRLMTRGVALEPVRRGGGTVRHFAVKGETHSERLRVPLLCRKAWLAETWSRKMIEYLARGKV